MSRSSVLFATIVLSLVSLGQNATKQGLPGKTEPARVDHATPIRKVQPVYPERAKKAGVQGRVVLDVVISKAGRTESIQVVDGNNPELVAAATDAVKQWLWEPFLVNGKAVSVTTQVTMNFVLPNRPRTITERPKR